MGAETTCVVTFKGKKLTARVRLETNVLQIRAADLRLDVPFNMMKKVASRNGSLLIDHGGGRLTLALGNSAVKWVDKILHPPSRLTKIGARPEWHAAIVGAIDSEFVDELRAAIAALSVGRTVKGADAIFIGLAHPSDFECVAAAKSAIKADGAVWLIRPKGSAAVTERAVMAAGKSAGLVDVKVVALSPTHSALKFVIPLKDR
jgi:hypothetical protein